MCNALAWIWILRWSSELVFTSKSYSLLLVLFFIFHFLAYIDIDDYNAFVVGELVSTLDILDIVHCSKYNTNSWKRIFSWVFLFFVTINSSGPYFHISHIALFQEVRNTFFYFPISFVLSFFLSFVFLLIHFQTVGFCKQ